MKKGFLPLVLLLLCCRCFATHCRSAELTFKITGYLQVEATLITYTKVSGQSGLADQDSMDINWGDGTSSFARRINGSLGNDGYPSGEMVMPDLKMNVYRTNHRYTSLPPRQPGYFEISSYQSTRQDGINNISGGNSVSIPMYILASAYLFSDTAFLGNNSSPVFLNPPVYYANVGDSFRFNPVVYDPNGDSISFEMITPMQDNLDTVPLYQNLTEYCQSVNHPCTMAFDSLTGQINWNTPCQVGLYTIAIRAKEYRCGILIGTVMRDMEIIVLQESNDPPQLHFSIADTVIQPGQTLQFNISASDLQVSQTDSIAMMGSAFLDTANAPVFQSFTGNPASAIFSWTPGPAAANKNAYLFTLLAFDNYILNGTNGPEVVPFTDCKSFRVWVADTTLNTCTISSVNEISDEQPQVKIFPNPTNGELQINSNEAWENMVIYNVTGKKMMEDKRVSSSSQISTTSLADGMYFLQLGYKNRSETHKFIKTK